MAGDVVRYDEVTSTNDLARDHARRGAPELSVVCARYQAAGRGRQGRSWLAPAGTSLLVSIILRPPPTLARSAWLTLAGGVAVAEAVRGTCDLPARLKWPNDVRLNGFKVAGVLTDSFRHEGTAHAVVGIGLNVTQTAEQLAPDLPEASSLNAVAAGAGSWQPDELLQPVRERFGELYQELLRADFVAVRRRWETLDETVGRAVSVTTGESTWRGRATRVDDYGALWIEDEAGELRQVIAGDVTIRLEP